MELIVRQPINYKPELYFGTEEHRKKLEIRSFFERYGTLPNAKEVLTEVSFDSNLDMETPFLNRSKNNEITRFYMGELVRFFLKEMEMQNFVSYCPDLAMYTLIGFLECSGILKRYESKTYQVLNSHLHEQIRTEKDEMGYMTTYSINGVTNYKGLSQEYDSKNFAPFISDYEVNKYLNRDNYLKLMDFKHTYRVCLANFHKSKEGKVIIEMYPCEYSTGFYTLEDILEISKIEIITGEVDAINNGMTKSGFYEEQKSKNFEQQLRELKEIDLYLPPTQWEITNWDQEQTPPF